MGSYVNRGKLYNNSQYFAIEEGEEVNEKEWESGRQGARGGGNVGGLDHPAPSSPLM